MLDFIYKINNQPCEAVFKLLRETVYGTKGVRINHKDTDKKLSQLHQPDFHALWKGQELLAVAVYCKRAMLLNEEVVDAYYIRYFSVGSKFQNQGLGKKLTQEIEAYYKRTITKKLFFMLISKKKT